MDKPMQPAWKPPMDKPAAGDNKASPGPANSPWRAFEGFALQHPATAAKLAYGIATTPAHALPRADVSKIPDLRYLGPLNPRLQAHVWNEGVAPALEFAGSPAGLEGGIILGSLRGAAQFSTPAKVAFKGVQGLVGGMMLWASAKQAPETYHVTRNPKSTFDDVAKAWTKQLTDATFGILAGFGMLEKGDGGEGAAALNEIARKGQAPSEVVNDLRAKSEIAKGEEAVPLAVAADRIEDHTAEPGEITKTEPPEEPQSEEKPEKGETKAEPDKEEPKGAPTQEEWEAKTKEISESMERKPDEGELPESPKTLIPRLIDQVKDMLRLIPKETKEEAVQRRISALGEKVADAKAQGAEALAAEKDWAREQDKLGRDNARTIRDSLLKIASQLPHGERGRFNAAITDAMNRPALGYSSEGMYQRAMHVMFRMMDRFDEVERNGIVDEINTTAKKALDSPSVDVEYKKRIQQALGRTAFKSLSDERRARLEATRAFISKGGEVPQDVIAQLDMLSQTNAKDLPISTLTALRDRVQLLERLGRTMQKSRTALYNSEKEALSADLKASEGRAIEEIPIKASPGQAMTPLQRTAQNMTNRVIKGLNYAGKIGRSLYGRDIAMDILDKDAGYKGPISRIFGGKIDLDYNAEMNLRRAFQEPLERLMKDNKYTGVEGERISIYAISKEENGGQRLLDSGVTPETIRHVNETITPKELAFYTTARRMFDDTVYPSLKTFMRDTYNVDVKQTENYWPFQRDPNLVEPGIAAVAPKAESGESVGFDEMATWKQLQQDFVPRMSTKAEKGMTIERVHEARGAVRLNAMDVVDRHIRQTAHLLANQRDLKMLGEIARQDWFKEKYGRLGQDYILKTLDTVSRDASPAGSTRTAWIDWLTNNTSVGVIGLRVLSQLKHLPNMAFSLKNVRPDYLVKGLTESMTAEGRYFLQKNFAEISQRSGGEPAIADISNGGIWKKIQKGSFVLERALDAMDARATVMGRYFQELEGQGIDHK